jgi:hypothetical protein
MALVIIQRICDICHVYSVDLFSIDIVVLSSPNAVFFSFVHLAILSFRTKRRFAANRLTFCLMMMKFVEKEKLFTNMNEIMFKRIIILNFHLENECYVFYGGLT